MSEVLLIRYGEVFLKGLNRSKFLKRLTDNIKKTVKPYNAEAWMSDGRIYVKDANDTNACLNAVTKVFGIHSVSHAFELEKDYDKICECCVSVMKGKKGSFKVFARRSDKKFPMDSMQLGIELGGVVLESNPDLTVDVHNPQHKLCVEIRDNAYVYVDDIPAVGGMPMGTGGKATLLLSGGIDSPVAGYQIMKRGVNIHAVHFASPPYTSERAKEKVLTLAKMLGDYEYGIKVLVVPFTDIQMKIHDECPEALGTLIMRRFMMRIAEKVAQKYGGQALITGESLGQVASQTMEALNSTNEVVSIPVFRPLIGLDKIEIMNIAEKIGTYETSILPYEDCCTVFTPRHPLTKPKKDLVLKAEAKLDVEGLVQAAVDGIEEILIQ